MKVFSTTSDFAYSWAEVTTANWQKYSPWNPKTPHVVAVDTLSRSVDPATGILRTERLITCHQQAPRWLQQFLAGADTSMVHEVSYVDPRAQTLTMCARNITWADLLSVRETVTYSPVAPPTANDKGKHSTVDGVRGKMGQQQQYTRFEQRAEITALCGGWSKIKSKIEHFSCERFRQNALLGKEGFEIVLKRARQVFEEERARLNFEAAEGAAGAVAVQA
jgi:hypothetical protein